MTWIRLLGCALLASILLASPAAAADEPAGSAATARERLANLIEQREHEGTGNLPQGQLPFVPGGVTLTPENQAAQQQAIHEYFRHVTESNEHQRRVFRWQLLSAKIIFVVVTLLVISGIYFAAVQFHHGLRSGKPSDQDTEFEASLTGFKVSSPVLGVVILTLSLAFFYLYLVHVYPIEFVGG